jgi:hypothetical protein
VQALSIQEVVLCTKASLLHRHKSSVGSQPPRSAPMRHGNAQAESKVFVRAKEHGKVLDSLGKPDWRAKRRMADTDVAVPRARNANENLIVVCVGLLQNSPTDNTRIYIGLLAYISM